jgi:phosphoribulokinase
VQRAFSDIFRREGINAVFVPGDSFRRYDRVQMKQAVQASAMAGKPITHFGPEANLLDHIEDLFHHYGETGSGQVRRYIHDENDARLYGQEPGRFTPWTPIPEGSDLLFYEGLHGGVVIGEPSHEMIGPYASRAYTLPGSEDEELPRARVDVARWVDLLIGVVPIINLEWIQKIHRDTREKGKSPASATATILRHMEDYIDYIVPQFSRTHINFQRVPLVDTSNPFIARDIPTLDESVLVVRFREPRKYDFSHYLTRIEGSFMSRANTMVVPGRHMSLAMEVICTSIIHRLLEQAHL